MIKTRKELKEYIKADQHRNRIGKSYKTVAFLLSILGFESEGYSVRKYLLHLRKLEYYTNNKSLLYYWYLFLHKRDCCKYGIYIAPNTVGKGIYIPHVKGGIYINCKSMGDFCTVSAGVIVGNKNSEYNKATIGDNVELTIGCKVIGKVSIGNNVIVAPNSVVIKDIEDNCIVSGVPAKIIKRR